MIFKRRRRDPAPENTATVVLAGGRSERFGSPKGLATLQGRPLVRWVAGLAAAVSARTVLVLAPGMDEPEWRQAVGQSAPVEPGKEGSSLVVAHDPAPHQGPVAGVAAALPHIKEDHVFLLAVDQPLLRPDLLTGLSSRLVGHDAVAYHIEGWWRPLPSLWRTQSLDLAVRRANQQDIHSMHGLLDLVDARPLGPEFLSLFATDASALKSINTREELEEAERSLGP